MKDQSKQALIAEVAELRRRVAELEKCQQQAAFLQAVPLGIHVSDSEGRITFVNPAQERITGYSADELMGTHIWDRIEPGPQKDSAPAYLKLLLSEQPLPTPYFDKNIRKNGEVFDVRIDWNYMRNPQGQVTGFISVVSDITAQRESDAALRKSERRLSTLMSNLPGMAYRCRNDSQWTMEFISDGCVLLTGYTPSAFTGNCEIAYGDIIHPDDRDRVWDEVQQAVAEGRHFQLEYRIRTASGEEKWVWEQGIAIYSDSGQVEALEGLMTDITERKRAEGALRVSEAKYRRLHQSMMDAFVSVTMDGRIQEYNEAYRTMLGYAPEELLALRYTDITPVRWHSFESEIVENQICRRGYSDTYEKEYRRKDDTIIPVELRTFLIADDHGQPLAMWAIVRDITARKRTEEALKAAKEELEQRVKERTAELVKANRELVREVRKRFHGEQRLALAVDAGKVGLFDWGVRSPKVLWTPELAAMLGYVPHEAGMKGYEFRDWADRVHPDDLPWVQNRIQSAMVKHMHFQAEYRVVWPDGSLRWVEERGQFFYEAATPRMVGTIVDITERKRAEAALQQSHDELKSLYDGMVDGLVVADLETKRFVRANPSMCEMLGYSETELLAMSVMDIHPKDDLPAILRTFETVARQRVRNAGDFPVLRRNGSVFFANLSTNTIVYNGRPCSLGFFRDITERKQAHEALKRERQTLQHMLRASDHERQVIAYDIHDGLAQQLAAALLQFEAFYSLKANHPERAGNAFHAGMTLLRQGHYEARRIINGVRPPVLDEDGVLAAIAHLVHEPHGLNAPEIEFRSRVRFDRLEPVEENAIYRIVQEGIANACKHSKSDKVRVSLIQRKDRVRIEVRDWGVGYDPTTVPKKRFGLMGIRERARLLGGKSRIRSKPGEGTSIVVNLPVVERKREE